MRMKRLNSISPSVEKQITQKKEHRRARKSATEKEIVLRNVN